MSENYKKKKINPREQRWNSSGASSPRAAARKFNKQGGLERFSPLFSSLPVVAFTVTCNKKKGTQAVCFKFFL
jgi:hypothetical protein